MSRRERRRVLRPRCDSVVLFSSWKFLRVARSSCALRVLTFRSQYFCSGAEARSHCNPFRGEARKGDPEESQCSGFGGEARKGDPEESLCSAFGGEAHRRGVQEKRGGDARR